MKKLNLNSLDDISLTFNGNELLNVSVVKAYSWGLVIKKQKILDQTVKYIAKYYKEQNNIENVIRNTDKLWETLTNQVAENNAQDFIDQGFLKLSKEKLLEEYYRYVEPFFNEIQYINDCYFDITADEDQKQAYREVRKESRGRVMGIGFGITGGIKASISAGIANAATGMAHSAFNAIANGIGNISKNNKLVEFYNNEETLEHLIDGWTESFWLIIDDQIELINSLLVEEETTGIIMYSQLMKFKHTAENIYNNLQKVKNKNMETYINTMEECLCEFPFEKVYWKDLTHCFCLEWTFNMEICNSFISVFKQLGKYIDEIDFSLTNAMINAIIQGYIFQIKENNHDSALIIASTLDKKLEDDEDFHEVFDSCIRDKIKEKNDGKNNLRGLFVLLYTLKNIDINNYKDDDELNEQFIHKMDLVATDFIAENDTIIFPELHNGNIDTVAKIINDAYFVDPEYALYSILFAAKKKWRGKEITITKELVENIEKLKDALSLDIDLNDRNSYCEFKTYISEIEAFKKTQEKPIKERITEFNNYLDEGFKEYGSNLFGKNVYWKENISQKLISNVKGNMGINDDAIILLVFDDTFFGSGKTGLVITSKGITFKVDDYCWTINWDDFDSKSELIVNEKENNISVENIKKEPINRLIVFPNTKPRISKQNVAIMINKACSKIYGLDLNIGIIKFNAI